MSEDRIWVKSGEEEREYSDFIKEAQMAYAASGNPALGRLLAKKQGEYTVEDYYALPEDCRVELIDGVIYNMASPSGLHQEIVASIFVQLYTWVERRNGRCIVRMAPSDVQLDRESKTMVQPDIYVYCPDEKEDAEDDATKTPQKKYRAFQGAPDFVAEVMSPYGRERDLIIKYQKYKNAGVREYWIVDSESRCVMAHFFEKGDKPEIYTYQEEIPVHIYNGKCRVALANLEKKESLLKEMGLL